MGKNRGIVLGIGVIVLLSLVPFGIQQQQYAYSQMSGSEMASAIQDINVAVRYMDQIGDFADQCVFLVEIGDTSRMRECAEAMADLGPVFQAWIESHPVVEELT